MDKNMNKIIITSDSTCDLSEELIQKHDIKIIPLYVNFGSSSFKDRVEMNVDRMYEKVKDEEAEDEDQIIKQDGKWVYIGTESAIKDFTK